MSEFNAEKSKNLEFNEESSFTWAPLVPLIGGFPIGIEKAFGKPPELIASYDGIINDAHYVNYQQTTLNRDIPFKLYEANDDTFEQKINLIVCTPPCAGLSSLNTSKNPLKQGVNGEQNQHMYNCVFTAAKKFDADVIMIENAPALATNKGKGVADKLYALGKELGYSLTLYKTSTHFHGIPQRRDRTFACFFKNKNAVVLEYQKVEHMPLLEFLKTMKNNIVNDETIINPQLLEKDVYYNFLKDTVECPRDFCISANKVTCLNAVHKAGLTEEVTAYALESGNEKWIKKVEHYNTKASQGLGVWDDSVHIFDDVINAVIGRNLNDTVHPEEDRSLTYHEALYLMGFPENFVLLDGKKHINHIAQNVPACTTKFMGEQAIKFLSGQLATSNDSDYIKVDNWNNKIEIRAEKDRNNLDNCFL